MLGKLISKTIKIVTSPVDMLDAGLDVMAGGDGSKKSRKISGSPLSMLTDARDTVCDAAKEIDD
jgi:hypothetical protein